MKKALRFISIFLVIFIMSIGTAVASDIVQQNQEWRNQIIKEIKKRKTKEAEQVAIEAGKAPQENAEEKDAATALGDGNEQTDKKIQSGGIEVKEMSLKEYMIAMVAEMHKKGKFTNIKIEDLEKMTDAEIARLFDMRKEDIEELEYNHITFEDDGKGFAEVDNTYLENEGPLARAKRRMQETASKFGLTMEDLAMLGGAGGLFGGYGIMQAMKKREDYVEDELYRNEDAIFYAEQSGGICTDAKLNAKADRIMKNLFEAQAFATENGNMDFKWIVSEMNDDNACCTGNGVVVINKGLLEKDDDIIAATLAHELGHGQGNHTLKEIVTTEYAGSNIARREKRNNENDADSYGFYLAANAGYNPGATAADFVLLEQQEQEIEQSWQEYEASTTKEERAQDENYQNYKKDKNNPTHPSATVRLNNMLNCLTKYSNNRVSVNGGTVTMDGKVVFEGSKYDACLKAGELAQRCHKEE